MFTFLDIGLAFIAVMLAASLFVSAAVQILQGWLGYRAKTLREMLKSLLHSFRRHHGDQVNPAEEEESSQRFVEAVLSSPILHSHEESARYRANRQVLAARIEYIHKDDFIDLVHNCARAEGEAASHATRAGSEQLLPAAWFARPGEQGVKEYATVANFEAYVRRWYTTLEGTASQAFKQKIRRLTIGLSLTLVVLMNLDGLQIIKELALNEKPRALLVQQLPALQQTALRLSVPGVMGATENRGDSVDTTTGQRALELQSTASTIDESGLAVGWQRGWIVRRWCAYKGACTSAEPRPTRSQLLLDVLTWLLGLLFSCVMLSLGAPFWVATAGTLINFGNAVQAKREAGLSKNDWSTGEARRRSE